MRFVLLSSPILLLVITFCGCSPESFPAEIEQQIESIRLKYAPDKRVALFEVSPQMENGNWTIKGQTNILAAFEELEAAAATWKTAPPPKLQVEILPSRHLGEKTWGIVNVSVCNIRSEPRHGAELATQALLGMILRVLQQEGDWFLVQTPDRYLGWLDAGGFFRTDQQGMETWRRSEKVIFTAEYGIAAAQNLPVSDLVAGDILLALGLEGDMLKVGYPDGRTAYAPSASFSDLNEWLDNRQTPGAGEILETATRFLGRPYLWGGTSPKAMDCSGFTKTVYYLNGLILPRDASQQVHAGQPVETDSALVNLMPGDFLFFGRKASAEQKEKITHVGIYLGDGRMIHSGADNPGVRIQSLRRGDPDFAPHRLESLVRARRMEPGRDGVERMFVD